MNEARNAIRFSEVRKGEPFFTPSRSHPDDAAFDLYASEMLVLHAGSFTNVPTNVRVKFPKGYYGRITGRSSTIRKYSIRVEEGIIDTGYTGELYIAVWNLLDQPAIVSVKQRLAQLCIHQWYPMTFEYEEDWDAIESTRGSSGFGSTGE